MGDVLATVRGIDQKLDSHITRSEADTTELRQQVRSLEDFRSRVYGMGAAVCAAWTALTFYLSH